MTDPLATQGCDTLAQLTKPTELHAKELEEQIPAEARLKVSQGVR